MEITDMKSMEMRLQKLEKQNRMWKICSVTTLALIGSLFLMGQASQNPRNIVAEQLTLRREDGKTFALFGSLPDGTSGLWLYDKNEKLSAAFYVSKLNAPGLELFDTDEKRRASLFLLEDRSPTLMFATKDGNPRALFGLLKDGSPQLNLYDKDGNGRAALDLSEDGSPDLRLYSAEGKLRARFCVLMGLAPTLSLCDKHGNPRASLLMDDKEGIATMWIADKDGGILWAAP